VPPPVSLGVYARARPVLSWALRPLGYSRPKCPRKSVSLLLTLLVLSSEPPYDDSEAEPQGLQAFRTWRFPPKRAPARMAFPTDGPALPFWASTCSGLFFRLGYPTSLARCQHALLAADVLPPNGRQRTRYGAARGDSLTTVVANSCQVTVIVTGKLDRNLIFPLASRRIG
jgi:hypothetical protein